MLHKPIMVAVSVFSYYNGNGCQGVSMQRQPDPKRMRDCLVPNKRKDKAKRKMVKGERYSETMPTSYGIPTPSRRLISSARFARSRSVVGSAAVNTSTVLCRVPPSWTQSRWLPGLDPEHKGVGDVGRTPSSPRALSIHLLQELWDMSIGGIRGISGSSDGGSDDSG